MAELPVFNVHCHLFNLKFLPRRIVKSLAPVPEELARQEWVAVAAGILMALRPGKTFDRARVFLETYNQPIDEVVRRYVADLDAAGIAVFTPLLMDFYKTVGVETPDDFRYVRQVRLLSALAARYPWRMFPFVMFDPRREGAAALCLTALREQGYLGVKMYPALGYSPAPRHAASATVRENLETLYAYCRDERVPITTHTSTGGAYALRRDDRPVKNTVDDNVWAFTEVANWYEPITAYDLIVNFAHFGGDCRNPLDGNRAQSRAWRRQILTLIGLTAEAGHGTVYADLAYHDMALGPHAGDYFTELTALLETPIIRDRLLFGTDASMISHTWSEAEYLAPFRAHLNADHRARLFTHNPARFLFPQGTIPARYLDFLRRNNVTTPPPAWIAPRPDGTHRVELAAYDRDSVTAG